MTYDHYADFTPDVESRLNEFADKIEQGLSDVIRQWNDSTAGSPWLWLSPGLAAAAQWALQKLEEACQAIWDEFEDFVDDVWEKVDDWTGDPWELMEMNAAYITAAGGIRDEKIVIDRILREVGKSWSGEAFTSFQGVAGEQKNSISGIDGGLTKAASACAEAANEIRSSWRDVIDALLQYAGSIIDAIKEGTNAGQWVSLEIGPAVKVIGDAVVRILDLWNTLDAYFDTNATVHTDMWRSLNSGLDGLDANNAWPALSSLDTGDMSDQGSWNR
ncbi:hypothetical protein [Nocardioides flavescens]|uniref:Uncharacterized protein n=1 Tax=Nocardioides flavescens TaxID=2691959 RepID=A0A6L7EVQ5_9ACTN|nr:hypothetical protein [Nocardioides flavescens]MXG89498.1 hypothetical protein [Nocardioides flavescens]